LMVVTVVCGASSTLCAKIIFLLEVYDSEGQPTNFFKPLVVTTLVYGSLLASLPLHVAQYKLLRGWSTPLPLPRRGTVLTLLWPAVFDTLALTCLLVGLTKVRASVYEPMRGSIIIFTAIFRAALRMPPVLQGGHLLGIVLISAAVCLVGTSVMVDSTPGSDPSSGILWITCGCLLVAAQAVAEERVMDSDGNGPEATTPPLVVKGIEAGWGMLLMLFIALPIAALAPGDDVGGCFENSRDSLVIFFSPDNPLLRMMISAYLLAMRFYSFGAIFVTFYLDGLWRSITESFIPLTLWFFSLLLFYFSDGAHGEAWTRQSWLQLAGTAILLVGVAIYSSVKASSAASASERASESESRFIGHSARKINCQEARRADTPSDRLLRAANPI